MPETFIRDRNSSENQIIEGAFSERLYNFLYILELGDDRDLSAFLLGIWYDEGN